MAVVIRENGRDQSFAVEIAPNAYGSVGFDAFIVNGADSAVNSSYPGSGNITGKKKGDIILSKSNTLWAGAIQAQGALTQNGAGYKLGVTAVLTAPYTVGATDAVVVVDPTAGNVAVTLPLASTMIGREITLRAIGSANNITLTPTGADNIEGANATQSIAYGTYKTVLATSGGWYFIS